jgi:short-subunit dehydrogenase
MSTPPIPAAKPARMARARTGLGIVAQGTAAARGALVAVITGGGPVASRPLHQRLFGASTLRDVLAQRTVLVTGASSGIGRSTALLAAEAGAKVILVARSQESLAEVVQEIEAAGGQALAYPADLASQASSDALLDQLARDGVNVDVLINNAGRSIRRSVADAYHRLHDYERTMAINYLGALRLILGLLPGMRERKRGHIINVSSAGVLAGVPLFSAYLASKSALDSFSRIAATESRRDGVRFSTIHMPLVRTPMIMPTAVYHDAPALTPEEAADMVLRPLVTGEAQVGTRLGKMIQVAHTLAPRAVQGLIGLGQQVLNQ